MSAAAYGPPDVEPVTEILVPLDRSAESEVAVPVGAMLSRLLGAHLYLVTVADMANADFDTYLDRVAHRVQRPCTVEVVVSPEPSVEIATRMRPGTVICMMSHGRGRLGQAVFGSVTADVVRDVREPIIVVGPHVPLVPKAPARILVPLDGSAFAEAALPAAAAWAARLDVPIHLITVVDPEVTAMLESTMMDRGDVVESSYVSGLAHKLGIDGHRVSWDVLHGRHPAHSITDEADSVPGTIVAMTTHGRTGLATTVAGSVMTRVVHHCASPVIALRPPELTLAG